jgi:hypothetical protein
MAVIRGLLSSQNNSRLYKNLTIDGVSLRNLEPVLVQIFNVSELDIILPILNKSILLTEMLHLAGSDVMRMVFDPFVEEMKQEDTKYRGL